MCWRRKKPVDFAEGVLGVVEAHEEALLAIGADHGGLEIIDVGAAYLVHLLDLNRVAIGSAPKRERERRTRLHGRP